MGSNHGAVKRRLLKKSFYHFVRTLLLFIFLFLLSIPVPGLSQEAKGEGKEGADKFSYLIENGVRMLRENEFEKVLDMIGELPLEKKGDSSIRALESTAYLKGYLLAKKKVYEKKWEASYKALIYSTGKSATPILVELLGDDNLYVRAFTAKALGFIGDKRALDELKRVSEKDKSSRVKSRAKWAYEQISGGKIPKGPVEEKVE